MRVDIVESQIYDRLRGDWTDAGRLRGVSHLLWRTVSQQGNKEALISPERTLTYSQWWYYMLIVADWLLVRGVTQGSRVVLYIPNTVEFYCAYFATWHVGAVVVPLNIYLHSREVAAILDDAQATVIITVASMQEQLEASLAQSKAASKTVLVLDTYLWNFTYDAQDCVDRDTALPPAIRLVEESAVILYTSGSTGVPKGVVLSGKNVIANTIQVRARFERVVGASNNERFLAILPLFHAFSQNASMWLPVMMGATIITVPKIERRSLLQGLAYKPTLFFGFPALFGLLVMMRNAPLNSIKLFVSGADALPDKIRMAFSLVYGRKIVSGYGLTEASPVVAVDGFGQDHPTNMVGRPLIGVTCQIRDTELNPLPFDSVGTLWVKGDNVMQGYYNEPVLTAEVLHADWLNTGDLATIDHEGYVSIVGRSKELIINKGFNIYPQEVENVLLRHPAVFKAAVIAKDEEGGQVPIAYVAVREGARVAPADIDAFCRENLAAYKVPRVVTCLNDLPMTATGKIDKVRLRSASYVATATTKTAP
ncbi:MAG: long-chain acyl-CoA synthetase [Candidatus Dependentiae bacterium]|nr:long-chain acyl-CoA synthetase [Candidatus Dependentiae bacterium]